MRKKKSFPKTPKTQNVNVLKRYHDKCLEISAYNASIEKEREVLSDLNKKISDLTAKYHQISTAPFKKPKLSKRPKANASIQSLKKYADLVEDAIKKIAQTVTKSKNLADVKEKIAKVKSGETKITSVKVLKSKALV